MSLRAGGSGRMRAERTIRDEERAVGEAHQEQRRLRKEAWAARGGTPVHRLWRRVTRLLSTEDHPPSGG